MVFYYFHFFAKYFMKQFVMDFDHKKVFVYRSLYLFVYFYDIRVYVFM